MSSSYADRMEPLNSNTIAFSRFSRRREWTSHFYWISTYTNNYANQSLINSGLSPEIGMSIPHDKIRFLPVETTEWKQWTERANNWIRQQTLLSDFANFDSYISDVLSISLHSSPNLLTGSTPWIDGILINDSNKLSVNGSTKDYEEVAKLIKKNVKNCTKGEFSYRLANIKSLLRMPDNQFSDIDIGLLEEIRIKRNRIAHYLDPVHTDDPDKPEGGRSTDNPYYFIPFDDYSTQPGQGNVHLTEQELLDYIAITYRFVEELDEYCLSNYLGCFEQLIFAVKWHRDNMVQRDAWRPTYNEMAASLPHMSTIKKSDYKKIEQYVTQLHYLPHFQKI